MCFNKDWLINWMINHSDILCSVIHIHHSSYKTLYQDIAVKQLPMIQPVLGHLRTDPLLAVSYFFLYSIYTLVVRCGRVFEIKPIWWFLNFYVERLHHVALSHDRVHSNRWCRWAKPSRHSILLPSQTYRLVNCCSPWNRFYFWLKRYRLECTTTRVYHSSSFIFYARDTWSMVGSCQAIVRQRF